MKLNYATLIAVASLSPLSPLLLSAADTAQPTTGVQAAREEAANRQKLIGSANQAISDGNHFLSSGNYDDAAKRFQYAMDSLTPGGVSATSYNRAEKGLAAAKAGQAENAAKDHKYAQSASLLQESIRLQPDDPSYQADLDSLKKEQLAYEAEVRNPEGDTVNPAVTDEFRSRVATVQKLLIQGDCYFKTGQFDKSEETYSKILILDPYNKAARDKMAHIELYRTRADGFRHEEYEAEKMERINHEWSEEISTDIVAAPPKPDDSKAGPSGRAAITRKLNTIIIDKVNFEKLDIAAVVQFLQQKSKELDPDHQGVNFVLRTTSNANPVPEVPPGGAAPAAPAGGAAAPAPANAPSIHREVSITLTDVPLSEVLGYISQQTNLNPVVEDYAVYLRPSVDEGETLTVRTFLVPANFFGSAGLRVSSVASSGTPSTVENLKRDVQQDLVDKGIHFPSGATAVFLPGSGKLVVRDTPEQLDLIANLIEQGSKEVPQVQIEAKIAEFNQDAIKGLTFNYVIGATTPQAAFGVNTSLRTAAHPTDSAIGGINPDGISELIQQNTASTGGVIPVNPLTGAGVENNSVSTLVLGGFISQTGYAAVITALNNLQGVSLLSAPNVTTQSGLKANIDIVREFPYPTSFEKPKLSNSSNLAYSNGPDANQALVLAIPPTPREFVTQDVGVSLEVKPTTYPDQRIDLDISKAQVLDFDGFIDYGVPIVTRTLEQSPPPDEPGVVLTPGTINQPVFNLRSMVTDLQVLDGQTAVLGGLIREDTQEINDKVPILGDIPLIGRAFQSKVTERTKKSLLIFITARLIKTNGKPMYLKTLDAEPIEEALPNPEPIGNGVTLPMLPEGTPNS